jgi:hypothetical protein
LTGVLVIDILSEMTKYTQTPLNVKEVAEVDRDQSRNGVLSRQPDGINYQLETPVPIVLHLDPRQSRGHPNPIHVKRLLNITLASGTD